MTTATYSTYGFVRPPKKTWWQVWGPRGLLGLGLLIGLICLATNIAMLIAAAQTMPRLGTTGASFTAQAGPARTALVSSVAPGSVAEFMGLKAGDIVRFDRPMDDRRPYHVGENIGLTVLGDAPRHVALIVEARSMADRQTLNRFTVIDTGSALLGTLLGLFILVRSRGQLSLMVLGLAFASMNLTVGTFAETTVAAFPGWLALKVAVQGAQAPLMIAFAILFYRELVGPLRPGVWRSWGLVAFLTFLATLGQYVYIMTGASPVFGGHDIAVSIALQFLGLTIGAAILGLGWMKSTQDVRRRYTLVLIAIACLLGQAVLFQLVSLGQNGSLYTSPLASPFEIVATAAPILFAYAVLRHKVVDIGFAINRTLVYGVISALLLVLFGVAEWAFEHFLPFESHEASVVVDAGIVLAIFLVFHRVRDFVEHHVEALFFRKWHENEARLRRFVKAAAFVDKSEALVTAFTTELTRFAGGAPASVYLAEGASYRCGTIMVDGDAPGVITLKAEAAPVEAQDGLYLPMSHRGEMSGFVRLSLKAGGDRYRPDEREVLAWAAHQVGLDLHALTVEHLQQRVAMLDHQLAFAIAAGLPTWPVAAAPEEQRPAKPRSKKSKVHA